MRSRSAAARSSFDKHRDGFVAEPVDTGEDPALRASTAALDYDIVTTRAGFDALASDWNALFARAGNGAQAFQTFNWLWHWCNHYLDEEPGKQSLAIVTGRRGGRLVLAWPLVSERSAVAVKLESMGAPVSQYSDALIEPSADATAQLREAWERVVAAVKPDVAWLPRVREDAAIAPLMKEIGAVATQHMEAPYVDLADTPDFDTYMHRRSSQARKRYRAAERRIAKLGASTIELGGSEQARDLAATAIDMKRRQLAERGLVSPAFAERELGDFFADAVRGGSHPTGAKVLALQCEGECAAANIVVGCRDRMLGHVFTYDTRFAKDSVGAFLLHHTIKQAIADGHRTLDLMAPADEYKLRSADGSVGVDNWAIALSAKGAAFMRVYLMVARPLLKAAVALMPGRLRRFIAQRYYGRAS